MTVISELRREPEPMPTKSFVNLSPGGNDTALFPGIPASEAERKILNDAIMKVYGNIEQVGFVNLDPNNAELMMAGGEFCGNATRSTAYLALDGQPGTIDIKVSGASRKLKAGVTETGEAFAQMPVYSDPERVQEDPDKPGNYTVEIEGITHYIEFDTSEIEGLTPDEINAIGLSRIKERGLDQGDAGGIMYTKRTEDGWEIIPVVYVKNIDKSFAETACGSGTTALGLVLSKESGKSLTDIPVMQPSGKALKVSVDFDGESFGYAQIQGSVDILASGDLENDGEKFYAVEQISTIEDLRLALEGGLTNLYQEIFAQAPYFESFKDEEVAAIFEEYVANGLLFLAKDGENILGFGAAVPITTVPELEALIAANNIDTATTWYMADLGVREDQRGKGLGKKLVEKRIEAMPEETTTVVMRTSIENNKSQGLYRSLGFEQLEDTHQDVHQERIDGQTTPDKRLFLAKRIR